MTVAKGDMLDLEALREAFTGVSTMGLNATILRPAYFMNNDLTITDVVTGYGVYPMPLGSEALELRSSPGERCSL